MSLTSTIRSLSWMRRRNAFSCFRAKFMTAASSTTCKTVCAGMSCRAAYSRYIAIGLTRLVAECTGGRLAIRLCRNNHFMVEALVTHEHTSALRRRCLLRLCEMTAIVGELSCVCLQVAVDGSCTVHFQGSR